MIPGTSTVVHTRFALDLAVRRNAQGGTEYFNTVANAWVLVEDQASIDEIDAAWCQQLIDSECVPNLSPPSFSPALAAPDPPAGTHFRYRSPAALDAPPALPPDIHPQDVPTPGVDGAAASDEVPPKLLSSRVEAAREARRRQAARLVMADTGAPAPPGSQNGQNGVITHNAWRHRQRGRRLVSAQNGQPLASRHAALRPGGVTKANYRDRQLVMQHSGEPAPPGSVAGEGGVITAGAYRKRKSEQRLVLETTGEPAPDGAVRGDPGVIAAGTYRSRHRLVLAQTGERAPSGSVAGQNGVITAVAYRKRCREAQRFANAQTLS